jgi:hypothetical protein
MITARRKHLTLFKKLEAYWVSIVFITLVSTLNKSLDKINSAPFDSFKKAGDRLKRTNITIFTILGYIISFISPTLYGLTYLCEPFSILSPYVLRGIIDFNIIMNTEKRFFDANALVTLIISLLLSIPLSLPAQIVNLLAINLQNENFINFIRFAPFVIVAKLVNQVYEDFSLFYSQLKTLIDINSIYYEYTQIKSAILNILFNNLNISDVILDFIQFLGVVIPQKGLNLFYYVTNILARIFSGLVLASTGINIYNFDGVLKLFSTLFNIVYEIYNRQIGYLYNFTSRQTTSVAYNSVPFLFNNLAKLSVLKIVLSIITLELFAYYYVATAYLNTVYVDINDIFDLVIEISNLTQPIKNNYQLGPQMSQLDNALKNKTGEFKSFSKILQYFKSVSAYKFYQKEEVNLHTILCLIHPLMTMGITRSVNSGSAIDENSDLELEGSSVYAFQENPINYIAFLHPSLGPTLSNQMFYHNILALSGVLPPLANEINLKDQSGEPPVFPSSSCFYSTKLSSPRSHLIISFMIQQTKPFGFTNAIINYENIGQFVSNALALTTFPAFAELSEYNKADIKKSLPELVNKPPQTLEFIIQRGLYRYHRICAEEKYFSITELPLLYYMWIGNQTLDNKAVNALVEFFSCDIFIAHNEGHHSLPPVTVAYILLFSILEKILTENNISCNHLMSSKAFMNHINKVNDVKVKNSFNLTNNAELVKTLTLLEFDRIMLKHGIDGNTQIKEPLKELYLNYIKIKKGGTPIVGVCTWIIHMFNGTYFYDYASYIARFIHFFYTYLCYLVYSSLVIICLSRWWTPAHLNVGFNDLTSSLVRDMTYSRRYSPAFFINTSYSYVVYNNPLGMMYGVNDNSLNEVYAHKFMEERYSHGPDTPDGNNEKDIKGAWRFIIPEGKKYHLSYSENRTESTEFPFDALMLIKMYVTTIANHYYHEVINSSIIQIICGGAAGEGTLQPHLKYEAMIQDHEGLKEISELLAYISCLLHWQFMRPLLNSWYDLIQRGIIGREIGYSVYYVLYIGYMLRTSVVDFLFTVIEKFLPSSNVDLLFLVGLNVYTIAYFSVVYFKYNIIAKQLIRQNENLNELVYTKTNLTKAIKEYKANYPRSAWITNTLSNFSISGWAKLGVTKIGLDIILPNLSATLTGGSKVVQSVLVFSGVSTSLLVGVSQILFKLIIALLIGWFMINSFIGWFNDLQKADTTASKDLRKRLRSGGRIILNILGQVLDIILYPVSGYINADKIKFVLLNYNPFTLYLGFIKTLVENLGDVFAPLFSGTTTLISSAILAPFIDTRDRIIADLNNSPLATIYWYIFNKPYMVNNMTLFRFLFSFRSYSMFSIILKVFKIPFNILKSIYFNLINANSVQKSLLKKKAAEPILLREDTIREIHVQKSSFALVDSTDTKLTVLKPTDKVTIEQYDGYIKKYTNATVDDILDFGLVLPYRRHFLYEIFEVKKNKDKKDAAKFSKDLLLNIVKSPDILNHELIFVLYLADQYIKLTFSFAKTEYEELLDTEEEKNELSKQYKKTQAKKYTLIKQRSNAQSLFRDLLDSINIGLENSYLFQDKYTTNVSCILGHILKQYPNINISEDFIEGGELYKKIYILEASNISKTCFIGLPISKIGLLVIPYKIETYKPVSYYSLYTKVYDIQLGAYPHKSVVADTYLFVNTKQWKGMFESEQMNDSSFEVNKANLNSLTNIYQMKQEFSFALFRYLTDKKLYKINELMMDMNALLESYEGCYQFFYLIVKDKNIGDIEDAFIKLEEHLKDLKETFYNEINQVITDQAKVKDFIDYSNFANKLDRLIEKLYHDFIKYDIEYCKFNSEKLYAPFYNLLDTFCREKNISNVGKYIFWYYILLDWYIPFMINWLANRLQITESWTYHSFDHDQDVLYNNIEDLYRLRTGYREVEGVMNYAEENIDVGMVFEEFINTKDLDVSFDKYITELSRVNETILV